jgi:hypothetical protein
LVATQVPGQNGAHDQASDEADANGLPVDEAAAGVREKDLCQQDNGNINDPDD